MSELTKMLNFFLKRDLGLLVPHIRGNKAKTDGCWSEDEEN